MEVGICSCVSGWTGKICKHQLAAAEASLRSAPQLYHPSPENKKMLVEIALGPGKVPEGFFQNFKEVDVPSTSGTCETSCSQVATDMPSGSSSPNATPHEADLLDMSDDDFVDPPEMPRCNVQQSSPVDEEFLSTWNEAWQNAVKNFATNRTKEGMQKVMDRLGKIKTPNMFDSFLHSFGSGLGLTKGRKSMIKVQPTSVSRRRPGLSRGASTAGKGRPPSNAAEKRAKRKRDLALNISLNQPNAKSH